MLNTILGEKGKMSQVFIQGRRVPVTKLILGPCIVTQVKSQDKDGYWAIQIGFGTRRIKNISKQLQGHLKGAIKENKAPRFLAEIRFDSKPEMNVGDTIVASDIFNIGDYVTVTGTSKGKGFAGVVKRWGFSGGPRTHGQSDRERAPGSIGQGTTPGRVYKGKKMAGRMGQDTVSFKNLQVISINPETSEVEVSGPIPGTTGGLVRVKKIASGKLEGITEVQAQVIEGEDEEGAVKEETKEEVKPEEVKEEPNKNA